VEQNDCEAFLEQAHKGTIKSYEIPVLLVLLFTEQTMSSLFFIKHSHLGFYLEDMLFS